MKSNRVLFVVIIVLAGLFVGLFVFKSKSNPTPTVIVTPTPESTVVQLSPDQQPKISLTFSADAHYVTVNISNLHADSLEYNLIYDATVKSQQLQTGVNASQKVTDKSTYSEKQLLGSESSGHFTYHSNIHNATMELTLRDSANRSIFTATYPFTVKAGASSDLVAASE